MEKMILFSKICYFLVLFQEAQMSVDNENPLYIGNKALSPFLAGSAQFLVHVNQSISTKTCVVHI